MSVIVEAKDSRLRVILKTGENAEGKAILKTKTFANIRPDAEDNAVYEVADSLMELQEHSVEDLERVNTFTLS